MSHITPALWCGHHHDYESAFDLLLYYYNEFGRRGGFWYTNIGINFEGNFEARFTASRLYAF